MEEKRKGHKSPWRFFFVISAVFSGGWILLRTVAPKILMRMIPLQWSVSAGEAATLGIIGGADGPTAVFVTNAVSSGPDWDLIVMGAVFLGSILGWFLLKKRNTKAQKKDL